MKFSFTDSSLISSFESSDSIDFLASEVIGDTILFSPVSLLSPEASEKGFSSPFSLSNSRVISPLSSLVEVSTVSVEVSSDTDSSVFLFLPNKLSKKLDELELSSNSSVISPLSSVEVSSVTILSSATGFDSVVSGSELIVTSSLLPPNSSSF